MHSKPPTWYEHLDRPKKFDASNSLVCSCGMVLAFTWKGVQNGVIVATCFGDWIAEMKGCGL